MELKRRNWAVYGLLGVVWILILAWQWADHARVQSLARSELIRRAKDVSSTVGTTIRLLRRFGGVVSEDRLNVALTDLLRPGEWDGISLLNEAGDVVASVGTPVQFNSTERPLEMWGKDHVVLINPVALGTNVTRDLEYTIIVDMRRNETNRPPQFREMGRTNDMRGGPPDMRGGPPDMRDGPRDMRGGPPGPPDMGRDGERGRGGGRWRFDRPPWWTDDEWKALLEKQGIHSFAVVMSSKHFIDATRRDVWLRAIIVGLAAISVAGLGFAWTNFVRTSDLQLRLVRASELTTHLREMNLAAAGLAHETRNPLNIIRGLTQMISKESGVPGDVREKARAIVDETDKVTAQLNEFINYSRPREVRRSVVALNGVISEVVRALKFDIEEKKIRLEVKGDQVTVEADEQMVRQVLFNLVLNATQALSEGGEIQIVTQRQGNEAILDVRDNGPGVPPERRTEIFKPYFTTNRKGTGLGLAIVQQIVLAHGWDVECLANEPTGAIFRISHLKQAAKT